MINKDTLRQEFQQQLTAALNANDAEATAKAFESFTTSVCDAVEEEFKQYGNISDIAVLQQRGLRPLTSEENAWYQKFIDAVKSGAKQAITNLGDAMVPTIIDRVIEDMKKNHPLLSAIDIQNAAGAIRLVMNAVQMSSKLGSWKPIGSTITTELTGQIKTIDITAAKYTAYFIIPKDFVKFNFSFAPMWVDQYIRIILSEAVANGLEKAFIQGTGNGEPIGLAFDVSTNVNGVYSEKAAVALSDWDDYAGLIADNLLVDDNGDYRNVTEVLMVVNPKDYIKKIRPSMNAITPAGIIDKVNYEFPTRVVTSAFVTAGTAKVGIAKNYFAAINGGTSGIIEYSDDFQFLDDNRVYTTRMYGMARPIDNTSFLNLDISALERYVYPVKVKGTVKTKEQA